MTSPKMRCPYCGRERPFQAATTCYYCHIDLQDEHIILIDEEGDAYPLCSLRCLDLLFESLEAEEEEEY